MPPPTARDGAILFFSPTKYRGSTALLRDAYIAAGMPVAIFLQDVAVIGITNVDFKIDGVSHHVETAAPWDYDGTDGMGNANRLSLPVGLHLIEAVVTDATGVFTVSANIEVE